MRIFKAPYQKNDLKKMKKRRRRRRRSRVRTWRRVICTAAAAAAATSGWLEVPCMMPCNTPLYKSMWRLFSLISACTRHYLILIWTLFSLSFPSSSALGFFSRHLFFHQKCTGYLLMLQSLSCIKPSKCGECLRNRKKKHTSFGGSRHVKRRVLAYTIPIGAWCRYQIACSCGGTSGAAGRRRRSSSLSLSS